MRREMDGATRLETASQDRRLRCTWRAGRYVQSRREGDPGREGVVALIQIDGTADGLRGLSDMSGLHLVKPSIEDLGADRYRMSAYAPESLIPDLEARGLTVRVLMTSQSIDEFHRQVESTISPTADA